MYVAGKPSLNKAKYNSTVNSQYTDQHRISKQNNCATEEKPVTVAARAKACTVFARSEAGIVGSNPTQGMDV
jgi:hypothetical protein